MFEGIVIILNIYALLNLKVWRHYYFIFEEKYNFNIIPIKNEYIYETINLYMCTYLSEYNNNRGTRLSLPKK